MGMGMRKHMFTGMWRKGKIDGLTASIATQFSGAGTTA